MSIEIKPTAITTDIPQGACPACRKPLNLVSHLTEVALPTPGDLTVCLHCGTILMFNEDLTLRLLNDEDLEVIKAAMPEVYEQAVDMSKKFSNPDTIKFVVAHKNEEKPS